MKTLKLMVMDEPLKLMVMLMDEKAYANILTGIFITSFSFADVRDNGCGGQGVGGEAG